MVSIEASVGARGQVVIPDPIREQMGIQAGDRIRFRIEGGRIIVEHQDPDELLEAFLTEYEKRPFSDRDWDEEQRFTGPRGRS